jgi:hypothetical protein
MCAILSTTNSLAASHYSERRTLKKIKNKCHRGGGCVAGTPPSSPCFKNNLRKTFFSCLLVFSAVHFVSFLLSLSFVNCIGEVGSQFSECEADAARIAISHSERRKRRPVGRPPPPLFLRQWLRSPFCFSLCHQLFKNNRLSFPTLPTLSFLFFSFFRRDRVDLTPSTDTTSFTSQKRDVLLRTHISVFFFFIKPLLSLFFHSLFGLQGLSHTSHVQGCWVV